VLKVYPLSTSPQEEKVSTPTPSYAHIAKFKTPAQRVKALTPITPGKVTREPQSTLSVDAPAFFPHHDLNPEATEFDPFGFKKQCESPTGSFNLSAWQKTLVEDGIIQPPLQVETNNLHISTTGEYDSNYPHPSYTPTTPEPYFYSPSSYYAEPWWSPQQATSFGPTSEFPTSPFYDFPSPASCETSFFEEESISEYNSHKQAVLDVNLHPTCPRVNFGSSNASPTNDPGYRDPVNSKSLDLKEIVCQNVRGWNSSRKLESIIELMIRENISAMCIQEKKCGSLVITSRK
jgi:hypothetical protein